MTSRKIDRPHETEVTRASGKYKKWWVECSCGYNNGPFTSRVAAENDADDHILAISAAS